MNRIIVRNLTKEFNLNFKRNQGALGRFHEIFSSRSSKNIFRALDKVSFELKEGEVLGIIGWNGSGKSTLLRVLAGIYGAFSGEVELNGNLVPIIDLYIGMHDRLSTRDNIHLVSSLFGLSRRQVLERFESIVDFAGLEDFLETKVYQLSSGMKQRLAFSAAIYCQPDILLLDEVFEVGDQDFRIRSIDKIRDFVNDGASAILVSHELWRIRKYCDRVLWLEEGKVKAVGNPDQIVSEYERSFQHL